MKAAFDGSVVRPPYAGVQGAVLEEMRAIAGCLDDISACRFFCGAAEFAQELGERGAAVTRLPAALRRVTLRILWQQLVLPSRLQREGMEVLHALAYTAPLRCPLPYVLNVHDVIALERPDLCATANRLHMRCLLPASARGAAACIVSTRHVASRLQALVGVPRQRIHVLPLGVDATRFSAPAPRPAWTGLRRNERPYLLFVGNLEPKKDVGTLLDAYACCNSVQRADLVVAGRAAWKCRQVVARLRGWRGPGRVHWLGRVAADDLVGLMQHAAMLIVPSLEEGFGMPVLEAMAAGTPVIHSDHPALVEAAGNAGVSFRRGDAADLSGRIDALLRDLTWRRDLIAAGQARAVTLPWRLWGEGAVALLRQVLSVGRSG